MADNFYLVEPYGHESNDSKLERYWKSFWGKYGLSTKRVSQFDPYTNLSRRPITYILKQFTLREDVPDAKWVDYALQSFIREEFSDKKEDFVPDSFCPQVENDTFVPDSYLKQFLRNSEWENNIKIELPIDDSNESMAESIYSILCDSNIGSSRNIENVDRSIFVKNVLPLIEEEKRLLFILPGFPFKDQNRFRVCYEAFNVDFSEISFMIRLHNIIQVLYQVHPFGGDALILSDGRLYQDIFKVDAGEVERYQERLKYYRNYLNLQGDVSIIDLKEMIERADENGEITRIKNVIRRYIQKEHTEKDYFRALVQGMKWNMNSKKCLINYSDKEAWQIIRHSIDNIPRNLLNGWRYYDDLAVNAAVEYATVNLMLRWTDLLKKFFPEAIRCTVHPKKGQMALTSGYAWNGVAWSEKWPTSSKSVSTVPFYTLSKYNKVKLVRLQRDKAPCFFTTEHYNQVIDNAKHVLKKDGWNVDDIFGREFTVFDLNEFIKIGRDDENFNWERRKMPDSYYQDLLQFRINHYRNNGFGVHAIFRDGHLIGQMGLQVFEEDQTKVEYVIFLGKDYVNQGIGTKILTYLFNRCAEEGISSVYGVIRGNNDISRHVIEEKFHGKKIRTVAHYRQEGILYEVKTC